MDTLANAFNLRIGYSDHSSGTFVAICAVARGATFIEKHITLDKSMEGPDHKASICMKELSEMVRAIRRIEVINGNGIKSPNKSEIEMQVLTRQKVVAANEIKEGKLIVASDLKTTREEQGKNGMAFWDIIGTYAKKTYKEDEPII